MSLKNEILNTSPTSYWPLDDSANSITVIDENRLHDGIVSPSGVTLSMLPFGSALLPFFDGNRGSAITIPDDDRYSHTQTGTLTVACWICPMELNFAHTDGTTDQYVHFIEKAVNHNEDVEWSFRLLNSESSKPSRLSFYLFNSGHAPGLGAGAYMQYGLSSNDHTPVEVGRWIFLVGQGEAWIDTHDQHTGAVIFKQGVQAVPSPGDKYNNPPHWNVKPHNGDGPITIGGSIGKSWFRGGIGHVALWDRLLTTTEVEGIWTQGLFELQSTPMYRPY